MSEWWTYRPSDFLMFSPRTYWRLFELQNEAWWPLQGVMVAAGLAWLVWMRKTQGMLALRVGAAALAVMWAFVAYTFVWQRYAPINWAASWWAIGLVGLSVVLLVVGARGDLHVDQGPVRRVAGLSLIGAAWMLYPLLGIALGRPWRQAELVGLAPDATAVATLGFLLYATPRDKTARWPALVALGLALAWCAISVATLWTMGSHQASVLAAVMLMTVVAWRITPRTPEISPS